MRAVLFLTCTVSMIALSACMAQPPSDRASEPMPSGQTGQGQSAGPKQATAAAIKPLDKTKFGAPITETTTTPLPAIVKDPSGFNAKTVRTEGMVSAVCQSMGCWMQIADASGKAHIKMAGHSFFVPKESSGHRAVVQGKVTGSNGANACSDADHCGNKELTQVQIEATGVEFID